MKFQLYKYFIQPFRKIQSSLQNVYLNKDNTFSLYDVFRFTFIEINNLTINIYAAAMAFNFFLSLFPFLIFLFSILPFITNNKQVYESILYVFSESLPISIYEFIFNTLEDLLKTKRLGLTSFSFIFIAFSSIRGTLILVNAIQLIDIDFPRSRNIFKKVLKSLYLLIVLLLVTFIGGSFLFIGEYILHNLSSFIQTAELFSIFLFSALHKLIGFLILLLSISIIYYIAPNRKNKWTIISPGTTFASVMIIIAQVNITLFISNFSNYNSVYGGLGTVMIIIIWFYWISIMILYGYRINHYQIKYFSKN